MNLNETLIEHSFDTTFTESKDEFGNKSLYLTGTYIQTDIENQNKRIYPKSLMEEAVKDFDNNLIKTKRAMGELNHPADRMDINPERACILITEIFENKNDKRLYDGKAKVLTRTPMGSLVEGLLADGVRLGVSTRGTGELKGNKVNKYSLKTIDVVSDPSAQTAMMNSIMEAVNNNRNYIYEIESLKNEIEKLKESLKNGSYKNNDDNNAFLKAIKDLKIG